LLRSENLGGGLPAAVRSIEHPAPAAHAALSECAPDVLLHVDGGTI